MALDVDKTTTTVLEKLSGQGFQIDDAPMLKAFIEIAVETIIADIQSDAEVKVTSGSSAGTYKVN